MIVLWNKLARGHGHVLQSNEIMFFLPQTTRHVFSVVHNGRWWKSPCASRYVVKTMVILTPSYRWTTLR